MDGTAVHTGSGHVSAAAGVPGDEVLAGLGKVQCLPDSASLTGCALRGLAAIGRGEEPDVKASPTATSLVELGCLLRDAGGALLERAGLLHGQPERGEVCAALHFLSFRCFCAVDVLHHAASGTGVDALPEGDALWGPILGAWLGVRGGGGLEGALADLTRWWISYKVHAVERVGARAAVPPSDSGTSGMADALASMRQQAEWLRGEAADELRSEVAAGHLESAAAAVEQLRSMVGSSKVVAARRLRPVSGMDVPDGVQCFESGTVYVLQIREGLSPTFTTGREDVEHWSSSIAVGTETVASNVTAFMRSENVRLAQGLPRFAQSVRGAALQHACVGAYFEDPMGSNSSVILQMHCEAGWPLSQVVNDEAWGDVGRTVRQKLCRAVLGTCAAAQACGVEMGGVGLDSFVLVGAESGTVSDVAAAVEAGSCQVLLGACSGVWVSSMEGVWSAVKGILREVLGLGTSRGTVSELAFSCEGKAEDFCEGLERVSEEGRASCMEAYAVMSHAEGDTDGSDLAGADAVVCRTSGEALYAAKVETSMPPFVAACKAGNLSKVRELLALSGDAAVDVHAGDGDGPEAAFRLACEHGHVDVVSELLGLEDDRAVDVWSGSSWDESRDMEMLYTGSNVSAVRELLSARHGVSGAARFAWEPVVNGRAVRTAMLGAQRAVVHGKLLKCATDEDALDAIAEATEATKACHEVYSHVQMLARGGHESVLDMLVVLSHRKQQRALDSLVALANEGQAGALKALASLSTQDKAQTFEALKSIAGQGHACGQINLSILQKHGVGVEKDAVEQAASEQADALKAKLAAADGRTRSHALAALHRFATLQQRVQQNGVLSLAWGRWVSMVHAQRRAEADQAALRESQAHVLQLRKELEEAKALEGHVSSKLEAERQSVLAERQASARRDAVAVLDRFAVLRKRGLAHFALRTAFGKWRETVCAARVSEQARDREEKLSDHVRDLAVELKEARIAQASAAEAAKAERELLRAQHSHALTAAHSKRKEEAVQRLFMFHRRILTKVTKRLVFGKWQGMVQADREAEAAAAAEEDLQARLAAVCEEKDAVEQAASEQADALKAKLAAADGRTRSHALAALHRFATLQQRVQQNGVLSLAWGRWVSMVHAQRRAEADQAALCESQAHVLQLWKELEEAKALEGHVSSKLEAERQSVLAERQASARRDAVAVLDRFAVLRKRGLAHFALRTAFGKWRETVCAARVSEQARDREEKLSDHVRDLAVELKEARIAQASAAEAAKAERELLRAQHSHALTAAHSKRKEEAVQRLFMFHRRILTKVTKRLVFGKWQGMVQADREAEAAAAFLLVG